MRNHTLFGTLAMWGVAIFASVACVTMTPSPQLVKARDAYNNASQGPAALLTPADLHDAHVALMSAENAEKNDPGGPVSLHLAYLAERRAELADAQGRTAQAESNRQATLERAQALKDAQKDRKIVETQSALQKTADQKEQAESEARRNEEALSDTQSNLKATKNELNAKEGELSQTRGQLDAERDARLAAEKKAQDAMDSLRKLEVVVVKEESRGTVITLSGSILFGSGRSMLLPSAQRTLTDVSAALKTSNRHILVEGHTDSTGSDAFNQTLSEARALSVLNYLVSEGVPADRIRAVGMGSSRPVEDNRTAEGRANNRRVEIILENPQLSSNSG